MPNVLPPEPIPMGSLAQASSETVTSSIDPSRLGTGKYVVAKGDNLYRIGKKHGRNHRELARWNNIDNPTRLRVGQKLVLEAPDY